MKKTKREVGTVWFNNKASFKTKPWYVQYPKGIEGYATKKEANERAEDVKRFWHLWRIKLGGDPEVLTNAKDKETILHMESYGIKDDERLYCYPNGMYCVQMSNGKFTTCLDRSIYETDTLREMEEILWMNFARHEIGDYSKPESERTLEPYEWESKKKEEPKKSEPKTAMTIKELMAHLHILLQGSPSFHNTKVMLSSDEEGNSFSTLDERGIVLERTGDGRVVLTLYPLHEELS